MTKPEKCDVCRKRKVKCDEKKPVCNACQKGKRPCTYTYSKFSHFVCQTGDDDTRYASPVSERLEATKQDVQMITGPITTLALRSAADAISGEGKYHTFLAIRKDLPSPGMEETEQHRQRRNCLYQVSAILREPCNAELRLVNRLLANAGWKHTQVSPMGLLGQCVNWIPKFVPQSRLVFLAAECLADSVDLYMRPEGDKIASKRQALDKLFPVLKTAILQDTSQTRVHEHLMATCTIFLTDSLLFTGKHNHGVYFAAIKRLLKNLGKSEQYHEDATRNIFYGSFFFPTWQDVVAERDSAFDNTAWLDCPPPSDSWGDPAGTAMADKIVMQTSVRLPRLVRLVRQARKSPTDTIARANATDLAMEVFQMSLEAWIDELRHQGSLSIVPTSNAELQHLIPNSFAFSSTRLHVVLLQYWTARVLVCGCIQALSALPLLDGCLWPYLLVDIEETDVKSAICILMSVSSILELSTDVPIVEIRTIFPLQVCFGAYYRLEVREALKEEDGSGVGCLATFEKAQDARATQIACLNLMHQWIKRFVPDAEMPMMHQLFFTDVWSGGSVPAGLKMAVLPEFKEGFDPHWH